MKKIFFLIGVFLFCCLIGKQGYSGEYVVVYDLYYQLTLYPESADNVIQENRKLFDERFWRCLSIVEQRAKDAFVKHQAMCQQLVDPRSRQQCEAENEAGKVWMWVQSLRIAISGRARWSETAVGQASIMGKHQLELLDPGTYEQIVRNFAPAMRWMLVCQ